MRLGHLAILRPQSLIQNHGVEAALIRRLTRLELALKPFPSAVAASARSDVE